MYLWKMRDIKGKLNYYLKENYIEINIVFRKYFLHTNTLYNILSNYFG